VDNLLYRSHLWITRNQFRALLAGGLTIAFELTASYMSCRRFGFPRRVTKIKRLSVLSERRSVWQGALRREGNPRQALCEPPSGRIRKKSTDSRPSTAVNFTQFKVYRAFGGREEELP
jgi:hypothetical protein